MFFKISKSTAQSYEFLSTDIHSHVLPGLDDGAEDESDSLALLRGLKMMGFKKTIPTPHVYSSLYPNTPESIIYSFSLVAESIKNLSNEVPILMGYSSEYMLDDNFSKYRVAKQLLPFFGNRILIEMGFADSSPMLFEEIFQLQLEGFVPVLAHPERYPYLFGQLDYFRHLVDIGCELQLNLLSFTDHYGSGPQKTALKLLNNGLYTWAGTDTHHIGHIEMLRDLMRQKIFRKISEYPFKNAEI